MEKIDDGALGKGATKGARDYRRRGWEMNSTMARCGCTTMRTLCLFLFCFAGARRMVLASATIVCGFILYTQLLPKEPIFFLLSLHCFVAHNVRESRVGRLTDQQK